MTLFHLIEENKIGVIWNEESIKSILRENEITKSVDIKDDKSILNLIQTSELNGMILLSELTWQGKNYSEFYGFKLLQTLRASREIRFSVPVVLTSIMPEDYFWKRQKENPSFAILRDPSVSFVQLPATLENIIDTLGNPLTEEVWYDVQESLCDLQGLVHEILHGLKNAISVEQNSRYDKERIHQCTLNSIEKAFQGISNLLGLEGKVKNVYEKILEEVNSAINDGEYLRLPKIIDNYEGQLLDNLPERVSINRQIIKERVPWKILLIEDEDNVRENYVSRLAERNLNVLAASNPQEALDMLTEDAPYNAITVVIADYRLEKKYPHGKWYPLQGYALLKEIYRKSTHLLSYFALTAAHRKATNIIQNLNEMNVRLFSKQDLTDEIYFERFVEDLIKEGSQVFNTIVSIPNRKNTRGDSWSRFRPYYRLYRSAKDYQSVDREVSLKADEYIKMVLSKDHISLQDCNYRFGGALKDELSFRNKLLARRIALGLFSNEFTTIDIYFALQSPPLIGFDVENKIDNEIGLAGSRVSALEKIRNRANSFISENLAIAFESDIPDRLLIEERNWLSKSSLVHYSDKLETAMSCIEEALLKYQENIAVSENLQERRFSKRTISIESSQDVASALEEAVSLGDNQELLSSCVEWAVNETLKKNIGERSLQVSGIASILRRLNLWPEYVLSSPENNQF